MAMMRVACSSKLLPSNTDWARNCMLYPPFARIRSKGMSTSRNMLFVTLFKSSSAESSRVLRKNITRATTSNGLLQHIHLSRFYLGWVYFPSTLFYASSISRALKFVDSASATFATTAIKRNGRQPAEDNIGLADESSNNLKGPEGEISDLKPIIMKRRRIKTTAAASKAKRIRIREEERALRINDEPTVEDNDNPMSQDVREIGNLDNEQARSDESVEEAGVVKLEKRERRVRGKTQKLPEAETLLQAGGWGHIEDKAEDESLLRERVEKLRKVIQGYSFEYHTVGTPTVSDAVYDGLARELSALEAQLPSDVAQPLASSQVGAAPLETLPKVKHHTPMLSLAAVHSEGEVRTWHKKLLQRIVALDKETVPHGGLQWVVEPKVDGLAVTLRFKEGKLTLGGTRGDGVLGEDVTGNIRTMQQIPEHLPQVKSPLPVEMEVRGEVYMTLENFAQLNTEQAARGERPFANARNAAAGSLRLLDPINAARRPLSFMAYALQLSGVQKAADANDTGLEHIHACLPRSHWARLALLAELGFPVNPHNRNFSDFEAAMEYAKTWQQLRESLGYEVDGVVLKVDDVALQEALGSIGRDPRWAIAWKFPATEATTILEAIELSIGRSGHIIPSARLQSVEVGGVTIAKATLHNFRQVVKLGLCEGDHVIIRRAGDVIPQVMQALPELRPPGAFPWEPPQQCPGCGCPLPLASDEKPMVSCENPSCSGRTVRQLEHYVKTCIHGLGPKTLVALVDAGLVTTCADLYHLSPEILEQLPGFGPLKAQKLVRSIQASKEMSGATFLTALGIPSVGAVMAGQLEKFFGSVDCLLHASAHELGAVQGLGPSSVTAIGDWLKQPANRQLLDMLKLAGVIPVPHPGTVQPPGTSLAGQVLETQNRNHQAEQGTVLNGEGRGGQSVDEADGTATSAEKGPIGGLMVVVTGQFGPELGGRSFMERQVGLHNCILKRKITKKTDMMVVGENPGPAKVKEANKLGVRILTGVEFLRLLGNFPLEVNDANQLST